MGDDVVTLMCLELLAWQLVAEYHPADLVQAISVRELALAIKQERKDRLAAVRGGGDA